MSKTSEAKHYWGGLEKPELLRYRREKCPPRHRARIGKGLRHRLWACCQHLLFGIWENMFRRAIPLEYLAKYLGVPVKTGSTSYRTHVSNLVRGKHGDSPTYLRQARELLRLLLLGASVDGKGRVILRERDDETMALVDGIDAYFFGDPGDARVQAESGFGEEVALAPYFEVDHHYPIARAPQRGEEAAYEIMDFAGRVAEEGGSGKLFLVSGHSAFAQVDTETPELTGLGGVTLAGAAVGVEVCFLFPNGDVGATPAYESLNVFLERCAHCVRTDTVTTHLEQILPAPLDMGKKPQWHENLRSNISYAPVSPTLQENTNGRTFWGGEYLNRTFRFVAWERPGALWAQYQHPPRTLSHLAL